jgi:hypothetical protein
VDIPLSGCAVGVGVVLTPSGVTPRGLCVDERAASITKHCMALFCSVVLGGVQRVAAVVFGVWAH